MEHPLIELYDTLLSHYGEPHWWPADTPYEVMVGAILTQNTAWSNVEKAIQNFGGQLSPAFVQEVELDQLAEIIRPSGFFRQKAAYLKAMTAWFERYDYAVVRIQKQSLPQLRAELLAVKGIGRETADSILLYAFGFPSFVVDTYTQRLCRRIPIAAGSGYEPIKTYFEDHLPRSADQYNRFHALIVIHAKQHCKKTPNCVGCPLGNHCKNTEFSI